MWTAIEESNLPLERFLTGPRRLFVALHNQESFVRLWEEKCDELVHRSMLGGMTDASLLV